MNKGKSKSHYAECLSYIRKYWSVVTMRNTRDRQLHLGLPHKYIAPNNEIFKYDQFYWDSYFVIVGLLSSGKVKLARGMVENFVYLFKRFNIVPMRNRYYNLGISQTPFLSSMAFEIYEQDKNLKWLSKVLTVAEKELKSYWMNPQLTEKHIIYKGLSRYCDHYITHLGAEHESGWDMTSRFSDRCLDFLPVDLNCCLYKYEIDIAAGYRLMKNSAKARKFEEKAEARKKTIAALMWNQRAGFFFDYNRKKKEQSKFMSVAGFYPMWCGLATKRQAEIMRKKAIPFFERKGGIVNTQPFGLSDEFKQHDFPNGWPQQQWIVIKGLLNYGYHEDAKRIAVKWLNMNQKLFLETGKFWEKHDVVECGIGQFNPDRYITQSGFAWTNAVFVKLVKEFGL